MSSNEAYVPVDLSLPDLRVLLGGVHEALFELGDDEFHVRVGVPSDEARELLGRLLEIREALKEQESDG